MMRTRTCAWATLLLLAGCSFGAPRSNATLALEQACRTQADRVFDAQHRDLISRDDQSMSPASSTGLIEFPGGSLGDSYARDRQVDDCVARRTSSTTDGRSFGPAGSH